MSDPNPTPPADKPVEIEGYYTTRTKGADGKPIPQWWMPTLTARKPRDRSAELAHAREKAEKQGHRMKSRTAREIAADLDAERLEKQTETERNPE